MIRFVRCLRLIFVHALRELLLSKKALLLVGGALLYAAIVALVMLKHGDQENNNELFAGLTLGLLWQALMPLTTIYFAIVSVREEIATRTLTYLISGPVPRSAIWLAKFAAATVASTVVLMIGCGAASVVMLALGDPGYFRIAQSTLEAPWVPLIAGVPAYAAIGVALALWFKRPVLAGAVFVLGWEEMVGSTPGQGGVRQLTVVDAVRVLFYHRVPAAERYRLSQREWYSGMRDFTMPSAEDALIALAWLCGVALLLALWIGARRDYDSAPKD